MEEFFVPVGTLRSYARSELTSTDNTLTELQEQLEPDECLVGHFQIGSADALKMRDLAPLLDPDRYATYAHLIDIGEAICLGYFAVQNEIFWRFSSARKGNKLISGFC